MKPYPTPQMDQHIEELKMIADEMSSFRNSYVNKFGEDLKKVIKNIKCYKEYFDSQNIVNIE